MLFIFSKYKSPRFFKDFLRASINEPEANNLIEELQEAVRAADELKQTPRFEKSDLLKLEV